MKRIAKFALVGTVNTGTDFAVYSALILAMNVDPLPAHAVSYSCGVLSSFIGNSRYTFREQASGIDDARLRFATFYMASLAGLLFASVVLAVLGTWFDPILAKALSIPPTMLFNFWAARRVLTSSTLARTGKSEAIS